jgi:hypothetical protein
MHRAILAAVTGLILSGCLEEVDPVTNTDGIIRTGIGPGSVTLNWQPPITSRQRPSTRQAWKVHSQARSSGL